MSALNRPNTPLIEYRNVTVCRGSREVLRDLNLSIGGGEHVAILGPNGSGKSTLIKTITRECYPRLKPDSHLRILGEQVWNIFELRALLGIVSNDLLKVCTRNFTVREILLSGFFSSVGIWPHHKVTAEMEERTRQVLALLEIGHLIERPMLELSTGEGRRVIIGRALVHDPQALVFDEPTASLDMKAVYELRGILRKIASSGTGIVMVTHQLRDIFPEITRIILLKDGQVFADGGKRKLLTAETLSTLFGAPFEILKRDGYYQLW